MRGFKRKEKKERKRKEKKGKETKCEIQTEGKKFKKNREVPMRNGTKQRSRAKERE